MTTYTVGFIMEQALGHITHTKNLQANVPHDQEIRALWGLVPFETTGLASRIPVYKSNWTVRAGLRARGEVARMARSNRLDALFFHTQVPAILAADWLRRVPGVVSLDATPIQYDALGAAYGHAQGSSAMEKLKFRLNQSCYNAAQRLVTWSSWAKQSLIDDYGIAEEKITVIPPGVNVTDWQRPVPRSTYTEGPARILFVGGDLERKGGTLLLEAFRALRPLGVELHLVTKDNVAPEAGLHVYHGMQPNSPELKALYFNADIFCLPTTGDCLPMVLSEAGVAELPAISTRVAGIPEIIRNDDSGLLINPGDRDGLIDALRQLVTNPMLRQSMGKRAAERVAAEFDGARNAQRLLDLIKSEAEEAVQERSIPRWRRSY